MHVAAVKIYVAAVEALRKKGKRGSKPDETQFLSFTPPLKANVLFRRFFSEFHPVLDQTQGSGRVFFLTLRISLIYFSDVKTTINLQHIHSFFTSSFSF